MCADAILQCAESSHQFLVQILLRFNDHRTADSTVQIVLAQPTKHLVQASTIVARYRRPDAIGQMGQLPVHARAQGAIFNTLGTQYIVHKYVYFLQNPQILGFQGVDSLHLQTDNELAAAADFCNKSVDL